MLDTREIAKYIQDGLDAIGTALVDPYEFSILAESGRGYDGEKVNGVVRTVSPEPAPYPAGYVEVKYVYAVELFVYGPENAYYLGVSDIVNKFISQNQAASVAFANGKGIMTFTLGVPKGYKIEYELGEGIPLTFTVHVTYTENGVTSGDKHWLLDGVEIPFLSESVTVEREGIQRKIYTEVYSKILLTGQTKFYTFRIPYESATFKALQAEILQSPAVNDKVHTLTYYDGAAFTQDKPYTAKVTIYRSASSNSTRPNASAYDVTFSDVYDSDGKALKYYISLIDFPFDMQGDDTRYFNSTEEQVQYFEAKAAGSTAPFIEIQAPNLDGLVITKQVYRAPAASALSQFDYVSKNYAVIKVVAGNNTQYFYYFIENATIGADGCVMVDLKMDTVQTYFFNPDITFSDCLIERAHLNRFVPDEEDKTGNLVRFVTDPVSKIYNSERGFDFPKRLVQRDKLRLRFTDNQEVDDWLNENVAYWVYIFIDPTHEYNVKNIFDGSDSTTSGGSVSYGTLLGATGCISYPIYKNKDARLGCKITSGNNSAILQLDDNSRSYFEKINDAASYYYSIKISLVPPFKNILGYSITNLYGNNWLIFETSVSAELDGAGLIRVVKEHWSEPNSTIFSNGLFLGIRQNIHDIECYPSSIPDNNIFLKADIKTQQKPNLAYNPKLNSQNFKELTIASSSGDTFSYDIQKLNDDSITFEYSEPITPEITKYYLRVKGGTGLYEDGTDENYTGLVGSTDNSLAYTNDQYANFIANNKNFYLQSNIKLGASTAKSVIGIVGQVASGNYAGAAMSGLTAGIDLATAAIDRDMTIDNMKNAPDQLKNANGNVIFNMFCTDLGLYVEKYSALEGDLKTANDFMNLYGFTFSSIANIKEQFIQNNHTYMRFFNRKYHNYIKAQLQSINGNLSNVARTDLRQRFATGIRFWNSDVISYAYENYELWLEN